MVLVDAFNIFLAYWILHRFSVRDALLGASVIGLLPSSYIGTSVWGQIDGIGYTFLLLSLLASIFLAAEKRESPRWWVVLSLGGIFVALLFLVKQLTIFSVIPLFLLYFLLLLTLSDTFPIFLRAFGVFFLSFLAFTFVWDFFLYLPQGYWSHLQYIWATGSEHGKVLSLNGLNIWIFLGGDLTRSSLMPLWGNNRYFSPFYFGVGLFLLYHLVVLFYAGKPFMRAYRQKNVNLRSLLVRMIFYLALANLSFNIFLTGMHERYLYYFYPLILLTFFASKNDCACFSEKLFSALAIGAGLYAVFVFSVLVGIHGLNFRRVLVLYHLALLGILTLLFLRMDTTYR